MTERWEDSVPSHPTLPIDPEDERLWRPYGRRVRRVEGVRPSSATAAVEVVVWSALAAEAVGRTRARGGPERNPASAVGSVRRASWSAGGVEAVAMCPATTATAAVGCRATTAEDGVWYARRTRTPYI